MLNVLRDLVDRLAGLPGVEAVALGGSRSSGAHHRDSDWDFGVYYREPFSPSDVRALGYDGTVVEIGEWGGGVFNGGAWLSLDGTKVDLLWRDLDTVDHEIAEAAAGRWRLEPLMFHLTGIPTYILLAELALNRVLHGSLPRPTYPEPLRATAGHDWAQRAELPWVMPRATPDTAASPPARDCSPSAPASSRTPPRRPLVAGSRTTRPC